MAVRTSRDRGPFTKADLFVCALIVGLGVLQFILCERAPDFIHGDVGYVELAKSLLHNGTYSFNFVTERLQPPGWPITLALVCSTIGCTHDILVRTLPVFLTSGLLLSYAVIRNQLGRLAAAASCLLLAASPDVFSFATSVLWPSFPYFFVSMLFLFLAEKVDTLQNGLRRFLAGCLLCLLLTAAVLIQAVGMALIGALLGWVVLSFVRDSPAAMTRLKIAVPVILVALLAQTLWLQRGGDAKDWQLPGYPGSYLSQLKLKSGNDPELGPASPKDIVLRVGNNLKDRESFLGEVLSRHWIKPSLASPVVVGLIVLILAGVWNSLLRSDSQLCALYFIGYECIYLLWPWSFDVARFTLPILPLSCLYLAEGAIALHRWSREYPDRVAIGFLPLSIVLAVFASVQSLGAGRTLQDRASAIFWIVSAIVCMRVVWTDRLPSADRLSWARSFLDKRHSAASLSFSPFQFLGLLGLTCLVSTGVLAEIRMGRENLTSGPTRLENTPEIQAALWIQSHTDPNAIIASRHVELVYHYSLRRVIWFPPISNPQTLMEGIREHHIQYVIVVDRKSDYYQPSDSICFDLLYTAYPQAFRLVEGTGQLRIYEVHRDSVASPAEKSRLN